MVVDDHGLVRAGLERLLAGAEGIEVVASAANGRDAIELCASTAPDVVLMDLSMPEPDGIAATRAIHARWPAVRVLVLTSFSDRERILAALRAGAVGHLLKDAEPCVLFEGVRAAVRGRAIEQVP